MWKLNNAILINQCVKEEIKKEIKEYRDPKKMEIQQMKFMGWKSSSKRTI